MIVQCSQCDRTKFIAGWVNVVGVGTLCGTCAADDDKRVQAFGDGAKKVKEEESIMKQEPIGKPFHKAE